MSDHPLLRVEDGPEASQRRSQPDACMDVAEPGLADVQHPEADARAPSGGYGTPGSKSMFPSAPTSTGALPTKADADGFLDDLVLPSLVSAPEPLAPVAEIGPDGRVRVVEHAGTRGRVNLYAAV